MKKGSIATLLAALALVLGLAACGGSDSSGDTTAADSTEQTTESTESEGNSSSSGELAPPGTQLKSGDTANLAWVTSDELSDIGKEIKGIPITATVELVEGSSDDLSLIELDPGEEDSKLFFVKLEIEATSGKEPPPDESPHIKFAAIDDRGQEQGGIFFVVDDYEPCEEVERPKSFANGESYETCVPYLVPGGGTIEEVQWDSGPSEPNASSEYLENPVVWTE